MANRKLKARTNGVLKRARQIIGLAGRVVTAAVVVLVVTLVTVQFARVIGQNVAAERQLSAIRSDIGELTRRRDEQERELHRLRDPQGVVPEIHDRLRLVRPNEAIIFVSPAPSAAP